MSAGKVSSRKAKGRRLQNLVAKKILEKLREKYDYITEKDVKPAVMGENGPDIFLSTQATLHFPYSVECKNREKALIRKWYDQAMRNRTVGTMPLLVVARNHQKPYAITELAFMKREIATWGKVNVVAVHKRADFWKIIESEKVLRKFSEFDTCFFFLDYFWDDEHFPRNLVAMPLDLFLHLAFMD